MPLKESAVTARCGEQVEPRQSIYLSGTALILQIGEMGGVYSHEGEDLCAHQKILYVVARSVVLSSHTGYVY